MDKLFKPWFENELSPDLVQKQGKSDVRTGSVPEQAKPWLHVKTTKCQSWSKDELNSEFVLNQG